MKILFWLSLSIVAYVYLGYPVLIFLLSILHKKKIKKRYIYPTVSVLVSVYNEEDNIENKIKSLLDLDYPQDKLEILIGSDGSTDRTEKIISRYADGHIKLYSWTRRQGKPAVLNKLVSKAKGEILVFSDARQRLAKDSLKELVSNFADSKVGSVSSELVYEGIDSKVGSGIGFYWKYEKFIRRSESRIDSMLGATGAMYAIRKDLFSPLPGDLILDDVYIPLKIVQRGYRAVFESQAKIYDKVVKDTRGEFLRKARTLAGNFQIFSFFKQLFNPRKSPIAWQFFSHKFLRLLMPFLLVIIFISNMFILEETHFYRIILIAQLIFYGLALTGFLSKGASLLFDIPCMFCVMNVAAIVGLYRFLAHKQDILWQKQDYGFAGAAQK